MMIDTTSKDPSKSIDTAEPLNDSQESKLCSSELSSEKKNVAQEEGTLCVDHNLPLNFWQEKEQVYACIKCLIDEEEVHFVDKSYHGLVENFKQIKTMTEQVLTENKYMPSAIADWKGDIRDLVLRVRDEMVHIIDTFTEKLIRQISKIEHDRKELASLIGEDRRQGNRLNLIEEKLQRITEILKEVEDTAPNQRAEACNKHNDEIFKLQQVVAQTDNSMKKLNEQVLHGFRAVVDVNGLSHKLFQRYLNFVDSQVKFSTQQKPTLTPKSLLRREGYLLEQTLRSIHPDTADQSMNQTLSSMAEDVQSLPLDQAVSGNLGIVFKQRDVSSSVKSAYSMAEDGSIQSEYRQDGANTLYSLAFDTPFIFLLDFKLKRFVRRELDARLPMRATSAQAQNGNIYVIGGMLTDSTSAQHHAQRDCLQIDANLRVTTKPKMHTARFDTPLAMVYERFILAFGGKTSKYHGTKRCEVYDTKEEQWINSASMPFFCVNIAPIVIKRRQVYLMPGSNKETLVNRTVLLAHMDCGALERGVEGVPSLTWTKLIVKNPDFVGSCPVAGMPLHNQPHSMLMFGGSTRKTFVLDTRSDVNFVAGTANVQTCPATLVQVGKFASACDLNVKSFGSFHYAIDHNSHFLHMFKERENDWEGHTLDALGITD